MATYLVSDTIALTDSLQLVNPGAAFVLNVDVLYQTDRVSTPTLGLTVNATDTIALLDLATNTVKFGLPFPLPLATPDRILLIDTLEVSLDAGRLEVDANDIFNLADSSGSSNTNSRLSADALALSDGAGYGKGLTITPDSLSLSDAATNALSSIFVNLTVTASDMLFFSDTVQFTTRGSLANLTDTLTITDAASISLTSNFLPYLRRYLNDV